MERTIEESRQLSPNSNKAICASIQEEGSGMFKWSWDDRLCVHLSTISSEDSDAVLVLLAKWFADGWDKSSLETAPAQVRKTVDIVGGLRGNQYFFTANHEDPLMLFCAWWPWGNGTTISIRIGCYATGLADGDSSDEDFRTWFLDSSS